MLIYRYDGSRMSADTIEFGLRGVIVDTHILVPYANIIRIVSQEF